MFLCRQIIFKKKVYIVSFPQKHNYDFDILTVGSSF